MIVLLFLLFSQFVVANSLSGSISFNYRIKAPTAYYSFDIYDPTTNEKLLTNPVTSYDQGLIIGQINVRATPDLQYDIKLPLGSGQTWTNDMWLQFHWSDCS